MSSVSDDLVTSVRFEVMVPSSINKDDAGGAKMEHENLLVVGADFSKMRTR